MTGLEVIALVTQLTRAAREASDLVATYTRRIDQVNDIVATREREGRAEWTADEKARLQAELAQCRNEALARINAMPDAKIA